MEKSQPIKGENESSGLIYISLRFPESEKQHSSFIWIEPTDLKWNDYGHHSISNIHLIRKGKVHFTYRAKVAVWDEGAERYVGAGDYVDTISSLPPIYYGSQQIFSVGINQKSYRSTIGSLGPKEGLILLSNVNDLVAISGKTEQANFVSSVRATEVFKYSLVRNSETYYALNHSKPILRGLLFEDISKGPEKVEVLIPSGTGEGCNLSFDFNYGGSIPRRTCVLIGKNGVGKSTALGEIARKALKAGKTKGLSELDRISASRVLAFTPNNEFTGTFPGETKKYPATFYKRLFTSRVRHSQARNSATAMIVDLARYNERIKEKSRFNIFLNALESLERPSEICLRTSDAKRPVGLHELRGSGEQRILTLTSSVQLSVEPGRLVNGNFYHLSTGEVRFIKLIAQACLYIENGTLLLFDEPETHLHPNLSRAAQKWASRAA